MESEPTRVMVAVNASTIKGYPHPSISSRRAFEWTLQKIVRSNTSGFKLLLIHVQVPDEDGFDDMDSIYASPDDFRNLRERDRARALHLLEFFVKKCHEIGVSCEAWIKKGDPKEVICHEVKRVRPDFLVVGSRGLGPFQKYVQSSLSSLSHCFYPYDTVSVSFRGNRERILCEACGVSGYNDQT